jgi:uncharacterized protein involved in exopolysaccharide biosynthesis
MSFASVIQSAADRVYLIGELFSFFWHRRWWIVPVLAALFLFGALIVLAQSSAVAPFIYTLF